MYGIEIDSVIHAVPGYAAFPRLYRITSFPPGLCHDEAMKGNSALEASRRIDAAI
jgi:hypothetical protein